METQSALDCGLLPIRSYSLSIWFDVRCNGYIIMTYVTLEITMLKKSSSMMPILTGLQMKTWTDWLTLKLPLNFLNLILLF